MPGDRSHRVVVGALAGDAAARLRARALMMSGQEVVFVGGGQRIDQLARTAQSEDAGAVYLDASTEERTALASALVGLDMAQVRVLAV